MIRVIVADDHALFRSGIVMILEASEDIVVVGECATGKELIEKYFKLKPDIILVDISMPIISGVDALRMIKEQDDEVKALFLSMHDGDEYIYCCHKTGGKGFISKDIRKGELIYAIHRVIGNGYYFGEKWNENNMKNLVSKFVNVPPENMPLKIPDLNERDLIIIQLIGDGFTSAEIAQKIFLSKRTIDAYRSNLMKKLNVRSRSELIIKCFQISEKLKITHRFHQSSF